MYGYAVGGQVCRQHFRPQWSKPPWGGSRRVGATGFLQQMTVLDWVETLCAVVRVKGESERE